MRLAECLWVRSPNSEQPLFHPITEALQPRGCRTLSLQLGSDPDSLSKLKKLIWKTDDHVMIHGLLGKEFHKLQPIFQQRRNFSLLTIDCWNTPF